MSVVVAVKDKRFNRYIMCADTQLSFGGLKKAMGEGQSKVIQYQVGNFPRAILGGVGRYKTLQILSLTSLLNADDYVNNPHGFSLEWVFTVLVPRIQSIFTPLHLMVHDKDNPDELIMPNSFLFACQDKCYYITGEGCVHPIADGWAIGEGSTLALGAITDVIENPFKKASRAVKTASQVYQSINDSVDYAVTVDVGEEQDYILQDDFDGLDKYWDKFMTTMQKEEDTRAQFSAYVEVVKSIVDEETFSKISAAYDKIGICEGSTDAKGED